MTHPEPTPQPPTVHNTRPMQRTSFLSGMKTRRVSYLDIFFADGTKKSLRIDDGLPIVMGRITDGNQVCLPYSNVSRHHARVMIVGGESILEDLNSTNGTYVNGIQVARCTLRPHDQIQVGEARIVYYEREEVAL